MSLQHNERKILLLHYANNHAEFTASQLAQDQATPVVSASVYCLRLYKQRLLERQKQDGVYWYSLSRKGRDRLEYLQQAMPEVFKCLTQQQ